MTGDMSAPFDADPLADVDSVIAEAERFKIREVLISAMYSSAELMALPPPEPLIRGILNLDSLAMICGPSGGGRSFLATDLALHVATGSRWNGREVKQGPVIYVAAEAHRSLGPRIGAWKAEHGITDLDKYSPTYWLTRPVIMLDEEWSAGFRGYCEEKKPVLVIFDDLARCAIGSDENSSRDMGLIVEAVDEVRRKTGACVAFVHHSGKDPAAGAQGFLALRAAVATEIEVVGNSGSDRVTVRVTKQKDGPETPPIHLLRKTVADSYVLSCAKDEAQETGADG